MEDQKEVITALERLAEKLGTKAELIFVYYLKQAKLFKFRYAINLFVSLCFLIATAIAWYHFRDYDKGNDSAHTLIYVGCAVSFIVSVCAFAVIFCGLEDLFTSITNPEYMATNNILNAIKNKD